MLKELASTNKMKPFLKSVEKNSKILLREGKNEKRNKKK